MREVLVLGGVSFNTMVYLEEFPPPRPGSVSARGYHETIGSTGAGKALHLHRLGVAVTLHGVIGEDEHGVRVQDYLARAGVRFLYDVDPAGTKRHVNLMDPAGRRLSIFLEGGGDDPPVDAARIERCIGRSDLVALNIVNYCRAFIPAIQAQGRPIWVDLHSYDGNRQFHRDFIDAADVLLFSSDKMPDYRAFMERMVAEGKELVMATHGKAGATALTPAGEWIEVDAVPAAPERDSNGAGDGFFAGVLWGHVRDYPLRTCLRLGALVGSLAVTTYELAPPDMTPAGVAAAYHAHYGERPVPFYGAL